MSDVTKTNQIDDLLLKTNPPNYLASTLEKQAAAGAKLPVHLMRQYEQLQSVSILVRQALQTLIPAQILQDCVVAHIDRHCLTVALPSSTAANHMRYLTANCVQALRAYDEQFCHLEALRVIVTAPTSIPSDSRQTSSKKTLSENTKRIINQTASTVIHHDGLKQALLRLANED